MLSLGKVKYVTKIEGKTGSSNHGEDDDISPNKEKGGKRYLFQFLDVLPPLRFIH